MKKTDKTESSAERDYRDEELERNAYMSELRIESTQFGVGREADEQD